jgi:DNA-binding transcriptional regulator YdaS (Cro superfamily)
MKLAAWLDLPNPDGSRKRRDDFADRIGVTPQMISAYCSGRTWPTRDRVLAIIRETHGDVTANDFIDMESVATADSLPREAAQ